MSTITDLWYGELAPLDKCGKGHRKTMKLSKSIAESEEALTEVLNEEQKLLLKNYDYCVDEYWDQMTALAFQEGFSLATKLFAEAVLTMNK